MPQTCVKNVTQFLKRGIDKYTKMQTTKVHNLGDILLDIL